MLYRTTDACELYTARVAHDSRTTSDDNVGHIPVDRCEMNIRSTRFLNRCWQAACSPEARRFEAGSDRLLRATQERLLFETIDRNVDCDFGVAHQFSSIRSVDDFRRHVPIVDYEEMRPKIERICAGEAAVLTSGPVLLLEPTSGTSSREKLVPLTASLRGEFQRAVRTWIYDLFRNRPAARLGRAYWSVSPLSHEDRITDGGLPIGFADDIEYLGRWERMLIGKTLAVPPSVALIRDVHASRITTLYHLLQASDLSLVSVWSPTFFLELLRQLDEGWESLCDSMEKGCLDCVEPQETRLTTHHDNANKFHSCNSSVARMQRAILLGEKLTEAQVATAVNAALEACGIYPTFVRLVPIIGPPAKYCLGIAAPKLAGENAQIEQFTTLLDENLQKHAHYRYARDLGQLQPIMVHAITSSPESAWSEYESACLKNGPRLATSSHQS